MKLSEAMRLGATLRKQAFGHYYDADGGSCAFGAAFEAVGGKRNRTESQIWPIAEFLYFVTCPACDLPSVRRGGTVTHLNDDHRWTREQIADWVEQIESQQQIEEVRHDVSEVSA